VPFLGVHVNTIKEKALILDKTGIDRALTRIAHELLEKNKGARNLALIGIQRGGVHLAKRLAEKILLIENVAVPVGSLDISQYRDDITFRKENLNLEKTDIPTDITNKTIILVDDVLFTGRSARAAMDALIDCGRPSRIQLAVLIDRGHRELPIRADFVGKNVPTSKQEHVKVEIGNSFADDRVAIYT